ncbi:MAG: ABC transporter ATP-binding protein [Anaerovoracaceae bacterium]
MAQLSCRSLSVGYDGKTVLHDIDFDINKGDYLCIVGENGTGKSTLMKTLLGLQPPLAGKIIRGYDMKTGGIGYLPQQTGIQRDFPASVREVVMSGCQGRCGIRPFYSRAEKQLVQRTMVKMEITHLSGKCYRELSGGQQQRTLLARALCASGDMLFLDEPVSGLDPGAADDMYSLVEHLNREDGLTIVMISHDTAAAARYASHILRTGEKGVFRKKEAHRNI